LRVFTLTLNTLAGIEKQIWKKYRKARLTKKDNGSSITLDKYIEKLDELLQGNNLSEQQHNMLKELKSYGDNLKASLC